MRMNNLEGRCAFLGTWPPRWFATLNGLNVPVNDSQSAEVVGSFYLILDPNSVRSLNAQVYASREAYSLPVQHIASMHNTTDYGHRSLSTTARAPGRT